MKYIEKAESYDMPAIVRRMRTLEMELAAIAPVIVAAQQAAMRRIALCPLDCQCHMCQLDNALADYYARRA